MAPLHTSLYHILGRFKVGIGWLVNAYSSHSIHMWVGGGGEGWFKPTNPRGLVSTPKMQGGGSTTKLSGIMKLAMLGFDM